MVVKVTFVTVVAVITKIAANHFGGSFLVVKNNSERLTFSKQLYKERNYYYPFFADGKNLGTERLSNRSRSYK